MTAERRVPQLTREQAAIITMYTGIAAGPFEDAQEYAEKLMGRPIYTHEFADKELCKEIKQAAREDFIAIAATKEDK